MVRSFNFCDLIYRKCKGLCTLLPVISIGIYLICFIGGNGMTSHIGTQNGTYEGWCLFTIHGSNKKASKGGPGLENHGCIFHSYPWVVAGIAGQLPWSVYQVWHMCLKEGSQFYLTLDIPFKTIVEFFFSRHNVWFCSQWTKKPAYKKTLRWFQFQENL